MKRKSITFTEAVNWEYVHAHHKRADGKIKAGSPFLDRIIDSARRSGFKGRITRSGAAKIANANLY